MNPSGLSARQGSGPIRITADEFFSTGSPKKVVHTGARLLSGYTRADGITENLC